MAAPIVESRKGERGLLDLRLHSEYDELLDENLADRHVGERVEAAAIGDGLTSEFEDAGVVLKPHVDGQLFEDYERADALGKQNCDPSKETDLFDVNANQQYLYVREDQAKKRAYGQNYTVEDHINVRLVSASQDEQDEHVYDLDISSSQLTAVKSPASKAVLLHQPLLSDEAKRLIDFFGLVQQPWFRDMMAFLKHSRQLKSLAFFNKENAANAIRLRAVLLQENDDPADEVRKAGRTLLENKSLVKALSSDDVHR